MSSLLLIKIGSISKLHHLLEKSTLDQELVLDFFLTFKEDYTEENVDQKDINTLVLKLSDGDYNNLKNKKLSRKIKKEIVLKLTQELLLIKEEELLTES